MSSANIIIPIIIVTVIVVSLILLTRNSDSSSPSPPPPPPSAVFTLNSAVVKPQVGALPPSSVVSDGGRQFFMTLPVENPSFSFAFTSNTLNLKDSLVVEYTLADPNNVFINLANNNQIIATLSITDPLTNFSGVTTTRTQTTPTSKIYNMKHVFSLGGVEPKSNLFSVVFVFTKSNPGAGTVTNNLSKVEMYDM